MLSTKRDSMFASLVILVLGLVFVIWGGSAMRTLAVIAGILCAIEGVVFLLGSFKEKNKAGLLGGAVLIVIGIILMMHSGAVLAILPILMGLGIAVDGIRSIIQCLKAGDMVPNKLFHIIVNVLVVVFGVIIMVNPFSAITVTTRLIGVVLIIDAVFDCLLGYQMY